jgi:hypothetical protein
MINKKLIVRNFVFNMFADYDGAPGYKLLFGERYNKEIRDKFIPASDIACFVCVLQRAGLVDDNHTATQKGKIFFLKFIERP